MPLSSPAVTRFVMGLLVGLAALWWAGRDLAWDLMWETLSLVQPGWVMVAVLGVVAVAMAKAARWGALFRATGTAPSFRVLFSGLLAGQAINLLIPLRLGELVRLGWMKQAGWPGGTTLATILLEKTLDLLATSFVAGAVVILAVSPDWLTGQVSSLVLISLTLVSGLGLIWYLRSRLQQWLRRGLACGGWLSVAQQARVAHTIRRMLDALGLLADGRSLSSVLGWTLIIWLLSLLTVSALFSAFRLNLPLVAAVLMMLAVNSSNVLPSPPALIGVMHLIAVVVLVPYGVAHPAAVGFGLVLNVVMVMPLLILGGWAIGSGAVSIFSLLRLPAERELLSHDG